MLAYLEFLCIALKNRDALAIADLLRHPLASALPPAILEEARRIASPQSTEYVVPIQALRLYHQTAHLLGACTDPGTKRRSAVATPTRAVVAVSERPRQMELELPQCAAVA